MPNETPPDQPQTAPPDATGGEEDQIEGFLREIRSQSQSDYVTFTALHRELRRIARFKMHCERNDHTLQATELVNEAFLKVFKGALPDDFWADPSRAIRCITYAMGQILTDHARAHNAQKRGGRDKKRVPLDDRQAAELSDDDRRYSIDSALVVNPEFSAEILTTRTAIEALRRTSARQANVVESIFYGGLTQEEVAAALNISVETVKLDWRKARAFLKIEMGRDKQKEV